MPFMVMIVTDYIHLVFFHVRNNSAVNILAYIVSNHLEQFLAVGLDQRVVLMTPWQCV